MPLKNYLKNLIAQTGCINVAEFMLSALVDENHGYYKTQEPFGVKGDFITAPEISQMFGELIGIWCADIWQKMGCPDDVQLVEMGPGRGTLMADLLRATRNVAGFHDAISISMVELSERLSKIQQEKLRPLHNDIKWFKSLSEVPDKPVIIVANELFDALPVHQYIKQSGKWHEKMLGLNGVGELEFTLSPPLLNFRQAENCMDAPNGSVLEVCPQAITIAEEISDRVNNHGGAALIIDYGYTKTEYKNTLSALSNHKHHDVLENIGKADISAHVDFELLARVAASKNAAVYGAIPQGDFLRNMGIDFRAESLIKNATSEQKLDIEIAKNRLTGNNEMQMGELFKALVISNINISPEGF